MKTELLEKWIVEKLSVALSVPIADIDPAVPFARLGLDSTVLIGFIAELEQFLNREIDYRVLIDHASPRALASYLED